MKKIITSIVTSLATLPLLALVTLVFTAPAQAEGDWCWSEYDGWYYCADQSPYPPAPVAEPVPCYYDEAGGCYFAG